MKLDDQLAWLENDVGFVCDNKACTAQAVYIVQFHRIDMCNKPPGVIASYLLCPHCTDMAAQHMGRIIGHLFDQQDGEMPEPCFCTTCGMQIDDLHDVFSVEALRLA